MKFLIRFPWSHWVMAVWLISSGLSNHILASAEVPEGVRQMPEKSVNFCKPQEGFIKVSSMLRCPMGWLCQTETHGPIGTCLPAAECCQPSPMPCYTDGILLYVCCMNQNQEIGAFLPEFSVNMTEELKAPKICNMPQLQTIMAPMTSFVEVAQYRSTGPVLKEHSEKENLVTEAVTEVCDIHDFPGCGIRPSSSEKKDDKTRDLHGWPWMASIRLLLKSGLKRHICAASLITKHHVLTAAHCFKKTRPLSRLVVLIGAHFNMTGHDDMLEFRNMKMVPGREYGVKSIVVHTKYQKKYLYYDIALVELDKEVNLTKHAVPICLPCDSPPFPDDDEISAMAIGWGKLQKDVYIPKELQQAEMHTVPIEQCNARISESRALRKGVTEEMICVEDAEGQKDACQANAGGPLVVTREDAKWIVVGIAFSGLETACRENSNPAVFTKIASFVPWILEQIQADR